MSRNLADRCCYFCQGDIKPQEEPKPITEEETGSHYFNEYRGMLVANAECELCEAKYLAWCSERTGMSPTEDGVCDLSFRSTFNDEPGADDMPKYKITRHVSHTKEPWPTCEKCGKPILGEGKWASCIDWNCRRAEEIP